MVRPILYHHDADMASQYGFSLCLQFAEHLILAGLLAQGSMQLSMVKDHDEITYSS